MLKSTRAKPKILLVVVTYHYGGKMGTVLQSEWQTILVSSQNLRQKGPLVQKNVMISVCWICWITSHAIPPITRISAVNKSIFKDRIGPKTLGFEEDNLPSRQRASTSCKKMSDNLNEPGCKIVIHPSYSLHLSPSG